MYVHLYIVLFVDSHVLVHFDDENACSIAVGEITFEKWADTLLGHDKASMDMDRIVWT